MNKQELPDSATNTGNDTENQSISNDDPPLVIVGQYIKDLSFEVPNAPKIFQNLSQKTPDIKVNVDVRAQNIIQNNYEVLLEITATCNIDDEQAFILELVYGSVFTLNVENENIQPTLLIECPRMIFPFARNIISDISRDGGFPPIMLAPVDFTKMYNAEVEKNAR